METTIPTATYRGRLSKTELFRLDNAKLNLYGQTMYILADNTVMIAQENGHFNLWVTPPKDSYDHLVELFGKAAFEHLRALCVFKRPAPGDSLAKLADNLQAAIEASEADKPLGSPVAKRRHEARQRQLALA